MLYTLHFNFSKDYFSLIFLIQWKDHWLLIYLINPTQNYFNHCFWLLGVFRECGGARCAHNMVPYPQCRHQALNIVQQLVLSNGGDDDMGTLLGLMHTAPTTALELKTHILKASVPFSFLVDAGI